MTSKLIMKTESQSGTATRQVHLNCKVAVSSPIVHFGNVVTTLRKGSSPHYSVLVISMNLLMISSGLSS